MKNTYKTKHNGMSEESKELIKEFKKTRQKNIKKKKNFNKDSITSLAICKKSLAISGINLRKKIKVKAKIKILYYHLEQ